MLDAPDTGMSDSTMDYMVQCAKEHAQDSKKPFNTEYLNNFLSYQCPFLTITRAKIILERYKKSLT